MGGYWDMRGFMILAKKNGRHIASDAGLIKEAKISHGPFSQMVPGWVGDPRAGYDTTLGGAGWRYSDDQDFVVYSSLDYDTTGVDASGSNFNDWPIRLVSGVRTYVREPLMRQRFPPAYYSDEDMFCVFKDTDTRADQMYTGPVAPAFQLELKC